MEARDRFFVIVDVNFPLFLSVDIYGSSQEGRKGAGGG